MNATEPWWAKFARAVLRRVLVYGGILFAVWWWMLRMPGSSAPPRPMPLTSGEIALREAIRQDVEHLAGRIGERNVGKPRELEQAAVFIEDALRKTGCAVRSQNYEVGGVVCRNIEAEIRGKSRAAEIVVIGAHYDSAPGTPGADDNASGVASLLALARQFSHTRPACKLRFVAFVNEEPPYFQTPQMGSLVYAKECRAHGDRIAAMLSIESVGYYSDQPSSQRLPPALQPVFPSTGNFVAFVGNTSSGPLVREALGAFRQAARLPSEGAAAPEAIRGVGWSDHWSFWQAGYRGIEITDTAPYRNAHYHTASDTPDTLDYDRLSRFTAAMEVAVRQLANPRSK